VNVGRVLALPLGLAVAVGLTACFSAPPRPAPTVPPVPVTPPPKPDSIPEVIPRIEPRARSGNPPFYDVFGKRYYVLSSSVGYRERGVASWYGPGFHKVRTSIGEPYDMYGMTAAHKTLPLPAYVRVTNLQNGRSVVVRVNDRGPFVGNRIIDLSYSAAAKLDMLRNGTAMVEVRTIEPTAPPPVITASATPAPAAAPPAAAALTIVAPAAAAPAGSAPAGSAPASSAPAGSTPAAAPAATAPGTAPPTAGSGITSPAAAASALFVQAGAFSDPANAERLAEKLRGGGYGKVIVRDDQIAGRRMYRVRIGPVPSVAEFDRVVAALERAGIHDAHLALD
jgi:rare lipoprotein A